MSIIKETIKKIISGAGIKHGEYNIEMYFNKNEEPFVIEINARQGGCAIPQMIQQHTGIDMNKLLVTTAMGDNSYFDKMYETKHPSNLVSRYYIFSRCSGCLVDLHIDKSIEDSITTVTFVKQKGDKIEQCKNAESVVAYVNMKFNSFEEQKKITDNIEELIFPIVE